MTVAFSADQNLGSRVVADHGGDAALCPYAPGDIIGQCNYIVEITDCAMRNSCRRCQTAASGVYKPNNSGFRGASLPRFR